METRKAIESQRVKKDSVKAIVSVVPKQRQNLLKWNGWGYNDSKFYVNDRGHLAFSGKRYPIGEEELPHFTAWVQNVFNIDLSKPRIPQQLPDKHPPPNISEELKNELHQLCNTSDLTHSLDGLDRLIRAHGHTLHDIFTLRESQFERIPDVVIWPTCHDHVTSVIELAKRFNCAIIPFGGGTSVSGAVTCPRNEARTIISLDTSQMNKMLWLDKVNLTACFESGVIGQDLERELKKHGLTSGHEPDSYEFSSLGGWVATRASGMKKNVYGNIEDLMISCKLATANGTLVKGSQAPRISCGPDFHHVILGSEGSLGVVTEVVLKVRPLPTCRKYGSIVFPNFEQGVKCMREVARQRCQPASIRLMDNSQFQFGQALKPANSSYMQSIMDTIKKFYVLKIKNFDPSQICVITLLFEAGDENQVRLHQKYIYNIGKQFDGLQAGERNGEAGYCLTFVIAYIRDIGLDYNIVSESFETSVPWDRTVSLCTNVKRCVQVECEKRAITYYMVCCRVTQTYDSGCCVYFYFAFNYANLSDPVATYEAIEHAARDEIIASGGSISHHHGVGKLRKKWYPSTVSAIGVDLYSVIKQQIDPTNIFACGNLVSDVTIPSKL